MAIRRLREMGAWLFTNEESIYGTTPSKIKISNDIFLTEKQEGTKRIVYVFLTQPVGQLSWPVGEPESITVLGSGMPLNGRVEGNSLKIDIPSGIFGDNSIQVLKVSL